MGLIRRNFLRGAAAALACPAMPKFALAAAYPARPVRMIVPFHPVGPPGETARMIAPRLTQRLGYDFVIEHMPGTSGNQGMAAVAKAPADGHTLLVSSTAFFANGALYGSLPYDPIKDFMPVSTLTATPNLLIVHPGVPVQNMQELVALITAHPGKYSYAQTPMGSTSHFSAELFRRRFRLDFPAVPFNAATAAVAAVLSGRVPIAWIAVTTALSHIKDRKLRALAVTSTKRLDALPEVPTITEAGASDLEAEALTGLLVPARTPNAVVERLSDEIAAVLTLPDVRRELTMRGMASVPSRPSEYAVRINREIARWRHIVRDAEIRAN
jgi:tripartite-type tricarboxylate transporter receptor subunit TctC